MGPFIWIRFLNFINAFLLFRNYLSLEKGGVLHLNKFKCSSPKDAQCQVWLKLAQWFCRRFLIFINAFLLFRNYLPLERSRALYLNKLEFPSPKDELCQVWLKLDGWNWPSGSGKEDENEKSLQQRQRQTTDKFWSEKLTWAFGSGELKYTKKYHDFNTQVKAHLVFWLKWQIKTSRLYYLKPIDQPENFQTLDLLKFSEGLMDIEISRVTCTYKAFKTFNYIPELSWFRHLHNSHSLVQSTQMQLNILDICLSLWKHILL